MREDKTQSMQHAELFTTQEGEERKKERGRVV